MTTDWLDETWTKGSVPTLPDGQQMTVRQSNAFRNSALNCWRDIVDSDFLALIRLLHVGRNTLRDIYTKLSDNGVEPAWAAAGKITRKVERVPFGTKHGDGRHERWCIVCQRWVDSQRWDGHEYPHKPVNND